MKKIYFLLAVLASVFTTVSKAQVGYINTFANYGACNIALDNAGKLYTAGGNRVYKIDSGGHLTTIVGGGFSYGDGGLATAARLNSATKLTFDHAGNMYIADEGDGVVRKVSSAGIISTVAGNQVLGTGYSGDGAAATAAKLSCRNVCVDGAGNLYLADENHHVIRKVNTAGIISTIAGTGTAGYSGDGGPATAAKLDNYSEASIWGMAVDAWGNVFISAGHNYRVRKIDNAGIITTVAGNGSTGHSGVGGPATAANMYYPQGLTFDGAGNLYMAEWQNCVLAVMNTAGILNTVSGNYTISFSGDGGPATAAGMNAVSDVAIDPFGNVYIADCHNSRIRKVTGVAWGVGGTADSLAVWVSTLCNGPQLTALTHSYVAGMYLKTDFGDGNIDSTIVMPGYTSGGYAKIFHSYNAAGTYTINQVLYNGATPVDTFTTSYTYTFCRTLPVKIFYDANGNCSKDPAEDLMSLPSVAQVDSNGITVDTVSLTGGLNYSAYCTPGSVYSFKLISKPGDLILPCPTMSTVKDTVLATVATYPDKYIALSCPTSTSFNFGLNAVVPVTGVNDQWGNIYVKNTACLAAGATVKLYFSPKWKFDVSRARPAVTSSDATSATWTIGAVSSDDPKPIDLYYVLWSNPATGKLTIRDTVHSHYVVTPIASDVDTTDNHQDRTDTVRGGCDPNEMFVSPTGHILSCTPLQYTINFENVGNDTAHNIYVMDTLSDDVDPHSLRVVMSSATMNISMLKYGTHNIVRFDFPKINLLDSSHHDACDGTVIFNINARNGLADGTSIYNHAGIFFDMNDVVMTDTVENIIGAEPISGGASVCVGATDTLINNTAGGKWTSSSPNATVVGGVVTGVSAGTATISYTVTGPCSSQTKTKNITIGSVTALPITGAPNVCVSSTVSLTDATPLGVWSSSKPTTASVSSAGVVSGLIAGTATISYTVTNACGTTSALLPVAVNSLPLPYTVTGGGSTCFGDTGTHIGVSSSDLGISYQLYIGSSKVGLAKLGTGSSLDLGLFTTPGTYTLKGDNGTTACSNVMTGSVTVIVDPVVVPLVSITAVGGDTICVDTKSTLIAGASFGGTAPLYEWFVNGVTTAGGATYTYTPSNGDVVTVKLKSNATCAKPDTSVSSVAFTVVTTPVPVVAITKEPSGIISKGASVTFTATVIDGGAAPAYQWTVNNTVISGATSAIYTTSGLTDKDSVSCSVVSNGTCGPATASGATIVAISSLRVNMQIANGSVAVYPNPVTDELTIETANDSYSSCTITNSIGQVLMQQPIEAAKTKVNVKQLPAGLYYVTLKGESGSKVQKFVKL